MKMTRRGKGLFALAAGPTEAILCRIIPATGTIPAVEILARFPGDPAAPATYSALADSLSGRRGTLSVCLPLNLFETVTLNLPLTNEEAMAKVLPFHLGKTLNRPLSDFVYDWQVVKRQKDSVRIAVFLLPAIIERGIKKALGGAKVKLVHIEPGVFSAFSFLGASGMLSPGDTLLTVIVYEDFISQGVYEDGVLRLVRDVRLTTPGTPFKDIEAEEKKQPAATGTGDDILSSFSLSASPEMAVPEMETAPPRINPWGNYLDQLNLEIIRGRDYYSSIMKGAPIEKVLLAGEGEFINSLCENISRHSGMDIRAMPTKTPGKKDQLITALAIGAASDHPIDLLRINLVPAEPLAQKFKKLPMVIITALATFLLVFLAVNYLDLERKNHNAAARLASLKTKEKAVMIISASRGNLARQIQKLSLRQKELSEKLAPLKSPTVTKSHYAEILMIISGIMPAQARCDRIEFDGLKVELQGQAVSHKTVGILANRLREMPQISGFSLNEINRTDNDQAPLDFRMTLKLNSGKRKTEKK